MGHPISIKPSIRILGILFDNKFNFKSHVKSVIGRVKSIKHRLDSTSGWKHGYNFINLRKFHTMLILPVLTYGCCVWWNDKTTASIRNSLASVHRSFALLSIRGFTTTSHTSTLALAGIPPIDMILDNSKDLALCRYASFSQLLNCQISLPPMLYSLPHPGITSTPNIIPFNASFQGYVMFTDGSAKNGTLGRGGCLYEAPPHNFSPAFTFSRSWQGIEDPLLAEAWAFKEGIQFLFDTPIHSTLLICTDSLQLVHNLGSRKPVHPIVLDIKALLHDLSILRDISISWIGKASKHKGIIMADKLAKKGLLVSPPTSNMFPSIHAIKRALHYRTATNWQHRYDSSDTGRYTHALFPCLKDIPRNFLFSFSSRTPSILLTGHGAIRQHLFRMDMIQDPICRLCNSDNESLTHLLFHCERLMNLHSILRSFTVEADSTDIRLFMRDATSWTGLCKVLEDTLELLSLNNHSFE
jgi:hypothetical protein